MECLNINLAGVKELVAAYGEVMTSKILDAYEDRIPTVEEASSIVNNPPLDIKEEDYLSDVRTDPQYQTILNSDTIDVLIEFKEINNILNLLDYKRGNSYYKGDNYYYSKKDKSITKNDKILTLLEIEKLRQDVYNHRKSVRDNFKFLRSTLLQNINGYSDNEYYRNLSDMLLNYLDRLKDSPVTLKDYSPETLKDFKGSDIYGQYLLYEDEITLKNYNEHTYLHELLHNFTSATIDKVRNGLSDNPLEIEYYNKIQELYGFAIENTVDEHYGLDSLNEFIAEAFTNKDFQTYLKNLVFEKEYKEPLWQRFINILSNYLNKLSGDSGYTNVLDETINATIDFISSANYIDLSEPAFNLIVDIRNTESAIEKVRDKFISQYIDKTVINRYEDSTITYNPDTDEYILYNKLTDEDDVVDKTDTFFNKFKQLIGTDVSDKQKAFSLLYRSMSETIQDLKKELTVMRFGYKQKEIESYSRDVLDISKLSKEYDKGAKQQLKRFIEENKDEADKFNEDLIQSLNEGNLMYYGTYGSLPNNGLLLPNKDRLLYLNSTKQTAANYTKKANNTKATPLVVKILGSPNTSLLNKSLFNSDYGLILDNGDDYNDILFKITSGHTYFKMPSTIEKWKAFLERDLQSIQPQSPIIEGITYQDEDDNGVITNHTLNLRNVKLNIKNNSKLGDKEISYDIINNTNDKVLGVVRVRKVRDTNYYQIGNVSLFPSIKISEQEYNTFMSQVIHRLSTIFKDAISGFRKRTLIGKGVGQQVYAELSNELKNYTLISDDTRSNNAEIMWQALERKGLAEKFDFKGDTLYRYKKDNKDSEELTALKLKYSQELIDILWTRLVNNGITNADNLIGVRETINNVDADKFWSNVTREDLDMLLAKYEANRQEQLDDFVTNGSEEYKFIEEKGMFTSSDTSFFDNKIKEVTELRDKLGFKEIVTDEIKSQSDLKVQFSLSSDIGNYDKGNNIEKATFEKIQEAYPDVIVVKSIVDLPTDIKKEINRKKKLELDVKNNFQLPNIDKQIKGLISHVDGKVYLISDNITSMAEAEQVYRHETLGHKGVIQTLKSKLDSYAIDLVNNSTKEQRLKIENKSKYYYNKSIGELTAIEKSRVGQEYIAYIAENKADNITIFNKIAKKVREILRGIGIKLKVSDNEIKVLISGIENLNLTKKQIALKNVNSNFNLVLEELSTYLPQFKGISLSLTSYIPVIERYTDNPNYIKYKKKFGEKVAFAIKEKIGLNAVNADEFILFINQTIPVKSNILFVLDKYSSELLDTFKGLITDTYIDSGRDANDLLKEIGYKMSIEPDIKVAREKYTSYYKNGEIICTLGNYSNRFNSSIVTFFVKDDALTTVHAKDLTQDNLNQSWKDYLKSKGRENADGTYNLKNIVPEDLDPYSVSVMSVQIANNDKSLKTISRYNHTLSNPDRVVADTTDKLDLLVGGLQIAFYNLFNLEPPSKSHSMPEGLYRTGDGKLFNIASEENGVYWGDNFYIKSNGEVVILNPNSQKMADGYVFNSNGTVENIKENNHTFIDDITKVKFLAGNVIEVTTPLGKVVFPVENGMSQQNTYIDKELAENELLKQGATILANGRIKLDYIAPNTHLFWNENIFSIKDNGILSEIDFSVSTLKYLMNLQQIDTSVTFTNSKVEDLGKLKTINGEVSFRNSKIESLNNLQYVKGDITFSGSKIKSLNNLETIGGTVYFGGSAVEDLGNLKSIGEDVHFRNSKIKSLGNLETIGKRAFFENSDVEDIGNLISIGGKANFENAKIVSLNNLKHIGGDINFKNSKVSNLGRLQTINGNVDFTLSEIKHLYGIKSIAGNVYLHNSKIEDLGTLAYVGGNFWVSHSKITSMGNLKVIKGNLDINNSNDSSAIYSLNGLLAVYGNVDLRYSKVQRLDSLLYVGGSLKLQTGFIKNGVEDLGNLVYIGGDAEFAGSSIKSLKNLKMIEGSILINNSKIEDLGDLQVVGGNAYFNNTSLKDIGNLKIVGHNLNLRNSLVESLNNLLYVYNDLNLSSSNLDYSYVKDMGKLISVGLISPNERRNDVTIHNSSVKPEIVKIYREIKSEIDDIMIANNVKVTPIRNIVRYYTYNDAYPPYVTNNIDSLIAYLSNLNRRHFINIYEIDINDIDNYNIPNSQTIKPSYISSDSLLLSSYTRPIKSIEVTNITAITNNTTLEEKKRAALINILERDISKGYLEKAINENYSAELNFLNILEFNMDEKKKILTNFATNSNITEEQARAYIDEALLKDKKKTVTELKDILNNIKPVVQEVSSLKEAISGLTEEQKSGLDTADFTKERKTEIIDNFASKYNLSKEKAIEYINEALVRDRELTINKLKECY